MRLKSRLPNKSNRRRTTSLIIPSQEVEEAKDYVESLKQLFMHLEEDLAEGLPSEADTATVKRFLTQFPQDGSKEGMILKDALEAFQTAANEKKVGEV